MKATAELTSREMEIIKRLSLGYARKDVADTSLFEDYQRFPIFINPSNSIPSNI